MTLFKDNTDPEENQKKDHRDHGFLDGVAFKQERIVSDIIPGPKRTVRVQNTEPEQEEEKNSRNFLKNIRSYSGKTKKGAAEKAREAREETRRIDLHRFVRPVSQPTVHEREEIVELEHVSRVSREREFTPKIIPTLHSKRLKEEREEEIIEENIPEILAEKKNKSDAFGKVAAGVYGAAKNFRPEAGQKSIRARLVMALLAFGILVGGFFILTSVFSSAVLKLRLKVVNTPIEPVLVSADPKATAINITTKKLPGLYVETTKTVSKSFEPKTAKFAESKAHGTLTIYNEYSFAPQTLVANTRFQTKSSGLIFRLEKQVVVPGAKKNASGGLAPSTIMVAVAADTAGENYNIGPTDFTIPGFKGTPRYQKIYARSTDKFSGGFKGNGFVAGDAEIKTAEEAATAQVFEDAKKDLTSKIPPGFVMINGAREIRITRVSKPRPGEAGTAFVVSADATAGMLIFKKEDILTLLSTLFLKPEQGEEILADKSDISYTKAVFDFDTRLLSFTLAGNLVISTHVDPEVVRKSLVGLSVLQAEGLLKSRPEFTNFTLDVAPLWARSLPSKPEKIKVSFDE